MVKCPNCGSENLDYSYYCSSCSKELPRAEAGWKGIPAQAPPPVSGQRFCTSCGRTIQFDANVCPYCGHDFRWPTPQAMRPETMSDTMRILLYVLSVLVPLAGIIIGIIFLLKPEPDYKRVGKICLIIGVVVGVIIPLISLIVIFGVILTF